MSFRRIWQSAVFELFDALRTRRAILLAVLYLAVSLLGMSAAISALGALEDKVAETLQVERVEGRSGTISATLWKSEPFRRIVRHAVADKLVFDDISRCHPAELVSAWIVFFLVPLLTVLMSAGRIAGDVRSGAVRFMLMRVTRVEWSLGKYVGNALLLGAALLVGALGAWGVAVWKLGGADAATLLPAMVGWSAKAFALSLAWLGFSLGVSHFFASGVKADAMAIVLMLVLSAAAKLIAHFGGAWAFFARIVPSACEGPLWRTSPVPVLTGAVWLVALGLFYLSLGAAHFARKDAR